MDLRRSRLSQKLAESAAVRRGFEAPLRELLSRAMARAGATPSSTCVEIGAGHGALAALLPSALATSFLFTEPCEWLMPSLMRALGDRAFLADAAQLPFESESIDVLAGLCVLDIVEHPRLVAHEAARVLRPGGALVHLLDLATELSLPLSELGAAGLLPLPNVFSPVLHDFGFPADLFVISPEHAGRCRRLLGACPIGDWLTGLESALLGPAAAPTVASDLFALVNESPQRRALLHDYFRRAMRAADGAERAALAGFRGYPLASGEHFRSRLEQTYTAAGFTIDVSEVWLSSRGGAPGDRLIVGHVERGSADGGVPVVGAYVFIARK